MKRFDLEGVVSMPHDTFKATYRKLPTDRPLIVADGVGERSKRDVAFLLAHGYSDVANLVGGLLDWESDGLPTAPSGRASGNSRVTGPFSTRIHAWRGFPCLGL
jgi:rhodanese-related sulfurtransferase